jgi:hypothetical protein
VANICSVAGRQQSQLETCSPSIRFQKVQPFVTSNHQLETREPTQDVQEHMRPLLVTLKTEPRPESDFLLDPERPSLDFVELPLVSLQEVEEMKSPS